MGVGFDETSDSVVELDVGNFHNLVVDDDVYSDWLVEFLMNSNTLVERVVLNN